MLNDSYRLRFANWMKSSRESQNLSQEDMITETGLALSTVIRLEEGVVRPTKEEREKIERCFRASFRAPAEELVPFRKPTNQTALESAFENSAYDDVCPGGHLIMLSDKGRCAQCGWRASGY